MTTFDLALIELDDIKNLKLGASHTLLMSLGDNTLLKLLLNIFSEALAYHIFGCFTWTKTGDLGLALKVINEFRFLLGHFLGRGGDRDGFTGWIDVLDVGFHGVCVY